ncbi:MAG: Uma2 family endonuclease [Planctomycetes bacterium]|nr:Uma2 family endonuclease [Planctomycetota bacterium]
MKTATAKTLYTAEEFFRLDLPEHEKWKLVGGELELAPAPNTKHQLVLDELSRQMGNWLQENAVALKVPDWDVEFLLDETRRPDLVITLKKGSRLKIGVHGHGTPDFIVEILSPGQEDRDLGDKKNHYERCGVSEYWVVDYAKRRIYQFFPGKDGRYVETPVARGAIKSHVLKGFTLKVKELFKVIHELPE